MSWIDVVLDNRLTGWGATGLLVTALILGLAFRIVVPRGTHNEIVAFWRTAAQKWETTATEALKQNGDLIGSQEISRKFYTEQLGKDPQTGDKLTGAGGD